MNASSFGRRRFVGSIPLLGAAAATAVLLGLAPPAARADDLKVVRVAFPGVGNGNRPVVGGTTFSVVHGLGWLQDEFKKDGIKVEVSFFRGAGPAVNEAVANGLADVWLHGDLPSIIGRAGGLKTKILLADGIRASTYVAVPSDSPVQKLEDLRGKRVAIFKGTNLQLATARFLAGHGLKESDLRAINMDFATAKAALATKDIDAVVGQSDVLQLRDQGIARVVYTTKGDSPAYLRHAAVLATEEFVAKHPEIVQRIVNVWVKAAYWASQEANRQALLQLWAKSGFPYNNFKEDFQGRDLKVQASPLLDAFLTARYKASVQDARRFGLIRNDVDVDAWIDRRFLDAALKTLKLETFWPRFDPSGKLEGGGKS